MKILTVIPLQKSNFKEELTYFSAENVTLGSIVGISIGTRKMLGLVVSVADASNSKSEIKNMDFNLKKIHEVKKETLFRPELIESIQLASSYFVVNKNFMFSNLIPTVLKENYDQISDVSKQSLSLVKASPEENSKMKTEKLLFQAPFEERVSYYKTLIRSSFAEKKSIYIVVPREHDVANLELNLKKGIEDFVIGLHGGLSAKKAVEKIKKVVSEEHPLVIIGTPMFLSVLRSDLQTIILEHESSSSYKTFIYPYIDLRTFTEIFAVKVHARLIFSDSLLRFETIGRIDADHLLELHPLSYRVNFKGELNIIEKNKKDLESTFPSDNKASKFKVISDACIAEIKNNIESQKSVFVFSLRKGLATMTVCNHCANAVTCDTCLAPIVLYQSINTKKRIYSCNKCRTEKDADMACSYCGSWDLVPLGIGTDTVYEELLKQFPNQKILKLDKETAKTSKQAEAIVKEFESFPGSILVGTELAMFYLKEKVELSVIASFDSLWSIPNYKMSEKILQIILNIMDKTEGKLIIETKNSGDQALSAVKNMHLASFVREYLKEREHFGYPPFKRFIKISYVGNKEDTVQARRVLGDMFREYNPHIFGGFVNQQKDKYVTNCLIKLNTKQWSVPPLSTDSIIDTNLQAKLQALPSSFTVLVDPEDLL